MGSLRNPIGPLPSSIYWRRRAVALSLVAVLVLLGIWVFATRGGDGDKDDSANGSSKSVPSTIGPGPSQSGPAISSRPGGRDESGDPGSGSGGPGGGSTDGTDGGADGGTDGSGADGGTNGTGDGTTTGTGAASGNGGSGTGGTGSGTGTDGTGPVFPAGQRVAAGSPLPDCPSGTLKLTPGTRNEFAPEEKPSFVLNVTNESKETCKADVGPRTAVFTITDPAGAVWSSEDCPAAGESAVLRVPAGSTISHTVTWDRTRSEPKCATPRAGAVPAGTYVLELAYPGKTPWERSFVLAKD
ncbi:hypothetical protein [Streptomyces yaizuensis]|uniref:DUF4232 domain-containing protein n=1 Tax=Streptomyces yaizuensis TaxID=2989713 RepID=A0ABQ5P0H2_9ACTN|nr:hypothetical protein [Streptomyces sp. YSPA8]GLF96106.1 hypothetical protein SYYSPA8_17435 [Streptomyces sp. YSPA8]